MTTGPFSEREDQVLRQCAAQNLSFGICAERLGRTRNMIAGRARRLGVKFNCSFEIRSDVARRNMEKRWRLNDGRLV